MDTARPQPHTMPEDAARRIEADHRFAVASELRPDRPVSEAEIEAILRLLGEDIGKILR
jgi:hypothetical protein